MLRRLAHKPDKIALSRLSALRTVDQLRKQTSASRAANAVGVCRSTLWRWRKAFNAEGLSGLTPKFSNSGRRSAVAGVKFSPQAVMELERLTMETGSARRAWFQFVRGPHCPSAVAKLAFRGIPAPVARLVKLRPLQGRCNVFVSADGRRLFVKIKGKR